MGSAEGVRAWVLMDGQIADNVHIRALEAYCVQEQHARTCQAYLDTRYAIAPEAPEHSLGKSGGGGPRASSTHLHSFPSVVHVVIKINCFLC